MIGIFLSLLGWIGLSPVPFFAYLIGTTEPALKLLLSILLGYPLGVIYNDHFKRHVRFRNLFFIITGLDIAIYNFGWSFYNNLIPGLVIYATTKMFGANGLNVIFTMVFNMTYLLVGYVNTESEDYDITWTMPQCVLTLKLIALSFDLWDGQRMIRGRQISETNKVTALITQPTFEGLMGFIYFPACFLVGPIFSYKRYICFISNEFPVEKDYENLTNTAFKRLLQGLGYLIAFQVGISVFSMKYMMSDEFWETSIFYRHFYSGLWAHFALYKYISCWLLTEASCIRFGLSFNGYENYHPGDSVKAKWDGCSNIKLMRFEGATKFQHYIDSFNCNTNHFAAEYIYKRLKFLGNRNLSQFLTLLFLALWHGTRSGYYMTFFNEFIIIYMEKEFEHIISNTDAYKKIWNSNAKYLLYGFLKTYTIVFMGWSLIPFDLKVYNKWYNLYASLYFSGFLVFLPWAFVYKPVLIKLVKWYNRSDK
ncbi:lysophospholipid acyltransferase 5 [Bicyclus anynana]|uniref:Lysophospholipid acyltransferase 5 n=1 Tax=Bicyclus anynana TaxID=110368 RepID=A0A6J1NEI6_BICAN|nr:lysophospholipid acyltransferase 5 [Bicyclus anynana]XP_023941544.2 lysophospholipid acyltransferase 5 [Bicyclus anynana]